MSSHPVTKIFHLSDLHFGPGEMVDSDRKAKIVSAQTEHRRDRLLEIFQAMPEKPDFLVISGDFTNWGQAAGYEESTKFLKSLFQEGYISSEAHCIVVPGNHDVSARSGPPRERFKHFLELSKKLVRPWFPGEDPEIEKVITQLKNIPSDKPLWGGANGNDGGHYSESPVVFPFVMDRERHVLIYAFNSAFHSYSKLEVDAGTKKAMEWLNSWKNENREHVDLILSALEGELSIDPAQLDPREMHLFRRIVDTLENRLGEEWAQMTKIAVLHHHVTPMLLEEVKKFELLTNAGRFKFELQQAGFSIVLHGHKHEAAILQEQSPLFRDGGQQSEGSLVVISGGTISGATTSGSRPGFYSLTLADSTLLRARYIPITSVGNPREALFANREVECQLGAASRNAENSSARPSLPRFDFRQLCLDAVRGLQTFLRRKDQHIGWSHHLDDDSVSAIATSFGLRIISLARAIPDELRMMAPELVESLHQLRHPDGCWSASYETAIGRPEATSWVMQGLWDWPGKPLGVNPVDSFEKLLANGEDDVLSNTVTSLTLAIDALSLYRPASPQLDVLAGRLQALGAASADGAPKFWTLRSGVGRDRAILSVINTARAVIALRNLYDRTEGRAGYSAEQLKVARDHLLESFPHWVNTTEDIARKGHGRLDKLVIKHFTVAWAVRALLLLDAPADHEVVTKGVMMVLEAKGTDGLWNWSDVPRPIWATYDALDTLQKWAIRLCKP